MYIVVCEDGVCILSCGSKDDLQDILKGPDSSGKENKLDQIKVFLKSFAMNK